jgi:hypothetical protein
MCIICGLPNPTHEELIVRSVLLAATSGVLAVPATRFGRGFLAARFGPLVRALRRLAGCIR